LKKVRAHKAFFSSQLNCSGVRHMYNAQEFRNAHPVLQLPLKSGEVESLGQAQEQGFSGEEMLIQEVVESLLPELEVERESLILAV